MCEDRNDNKLEIKPPFLLGIIGGALWGIQFVRYLVDSQYLAGSSHHDFWVATAIWFALIIVLAAALAAVTLDDTHSGDRVED